MPSLLLIVASYNIIAVLFGGIWYVRDMDQTSRDKQRKTYRLNFPAELSPEEVITWLRRISGTLRPSPWRLVGQPSVAFEAFATNKGIVHRLKIPYGEEKYIIPQLRTANINATLEDEFEDRNWVKGIEVGLTNTGRQLRLYDPAEVSTSLLKCFEALDNGEAMLVQLVISPSSPSALPIQGEAQTQEASMRSVIRSTEATHDEVSDRREKLAEPNFTAVLRVAGYAKNDSAATSLIERVRKALAATRGPSIRFHKRLVTMSVLRDRIRKATTPHVLPMQLSAPEVAALIAWPMGRPMIAGLAPTMTRHMPPSASIPSSGRVIGHATFPGGERPIAVAYQDCVRHSYVLGPSGVGKTTLLANMMAQDMQQGYGTILIESKGDLFHEALKVIPKNRLDDVIIIDVDEQDYPVGFNILDQGNTRTGIDDISQLIAQLYNDMSKSIQSPRIIYHMLHALAEVPGHTFIDLPALLSNFTSDSSEGAWQDWLTRQIKDKDVKRFLQEFGNKPARERDTMALPVLNRTWEFTNRPQIKHVLGQRKSSFKMVDVIRDNKILLVHLNGTSVGQQTASIFGTLLVEFIWQAVRQVRPDKPNFLYLDEFADFVNLPVGINAMLEKARSANLGLTLAHQHLDQLTTDIRQSVIANTATKIVFRTGADDAHKLARELGTYVTNDDLQNLGPHQTVSAVAVNGGTAPPVTVGTYPPGRDLGNGAKAVVLSRSKYGRPLEDVKRDIENRVGGQDDKPRRKPTVSGGDWFN